MHGQQNVKIYNFVKLELRKTENKKNVHKIL